MEEKKIDDFDNYKESLELFKKVYLYDGHKTFLTEYANSYIGNGENDIVRNDKYSSCVDYNENGSSTWKIISPKNIFGVALEHSVNHKKHNTITSSLILNSGRFDLNRMMTNFATIDVSEKTDEEVLKLVESILSKTNEQLINEYEITENPNGMLINAIILDTVLKFLKQQNNEKFPELICNADTGSIIVKENENHILLSNGIVQYNNQILQYSMTRKFPNCKYEVDSIKGDNELFGKISENFIRLNHKEKEKLLDAELLNLALTKLKLKTDRDSAKELYSEYIELNSIKDNRSRNDD